MSVTDITASEVEPISIASPMNAARAEVYVQPDEKSCVAIIFSGDQEVERVTVSNLDEVFSLLS